MTLKTNDGFDFYFNDYDVLYVCFSGFFPDEKGLPVFEFKNLMGKTNYSRLFIRDVYKCWYQLGINGLGKGIVNNIAFLKEFIKPYKKVIFIGNSMGGYASLLFAAYTNPHEVIAISPQTYLYNNEELNDERWLEYFSRARKFNANSEFLDLRKTPLTTISSSVNIYYSFNDIRDKAHVDLLQEINNVNKIACYGASHSSLVKKLNTINSLLPKIILNSATQEDNHRILFPKSKIVFDV